MSASPRFGLPFLLPGQAQKEAFHNEALAALDCALHACVEDVMVAPPGDPALGEAWIVAAGSTGAWVDKVGQLAGWTEGGWRFLAPTPGMIVWNKAEGHWIHWTGSGWADGSWPVASLTIGGVQVVGARLAEVPSPSGGTTIDAEARAAIGLLIATLKSHGLIE